MLYTSALDKRRTLDDKADYTNPLVQEKESEPFLELVGAGGERK